MSGNVRAFDDWIRTSFVEMNTKLEELYFDQSDRSHVDGIGENIKNSLENEGNDFIRALTEEGNTDEGFEQAFDLLGNLGIYMAALRRHERTNPAREEKSPFTAASTLGLHIGASLGVAPRFATSHLATYNKSHKGKPKSFTSLDDEILFLDLNAQGVLHYQRAADALTRIVPLGVTHPLAEILFNDAKAALDQVSQCNLRLFEELDEDRFFFCVRPYYKPYRVGRNEYRGANAGDFSGINEIDLLLGVCRANESSYAQILVDKMLFMPPGDQFRLREALRRRSLLSEFLDIDPKSRDAAWFQKNAKSFYDVCLAHGTAARQHHDQLVVRFIEKPASSIDEQHLEQVTASGPPLPVLIQALKDLRDMRLAAERDDLPTAFAEFQELKNSLN